jgi:putative DNA primase/helicase
MTDKQFHKVSDAEVYQHAILSDRQFAGLELPPQAPILVGLISEESITVINGYRGYGKTWLAIEIANEVSWGGSVGPWLADGARNVLYIDGEMQCPLLQERLRLLDLGRDIRRKEGVLYIYSDAYAHRIGLRKASLLDEKWREQVLAQIDELNIGLFVLDNLSSLAPGIDENEKLAFDPVNQWLLQIRYHGVAIIMLHHTGKHGEQRGTSAHEDNIDTALLITRPEEYREDMGCMFDITATKDRAYLIKTLPARFRLKGDVSIGERLHLEMDKVSNVEAALCALQGCPTMTCKEAVEMGFSARTYYRARAALIEEGVVDAGPRPMTRARGNTEDE